MKSIFKELDQTGRDLLGKISRRVGRAVRDYDMIREGDRILVAVSGGKDSSSLLHLMLYRQAIAPVDFHLTAIHVDSGVPGVDLEKLEMHFKALGIEYHIKRTDLFREKDLSKELNCFWCSWNRRKEFFQFATSHGYNKIALGHHMDDIVESILMNQFFKGELSAMAPRQDLFKGKVSIIRPLCYEREEMMASFAKSAGLLSFGTCQCPLSGHTQRGAIKRLLKEMEKVSPYVVPNTFNSLKNIKHDYLL